MAKNTYILAELKSDDPFNMSQREVKGELKLDKIKIEDYEILTDREDEYENLMTLDDDSLIAMFDSIWDADMENNDWLICKILPLSSNSSSNADDNHKRAEAIRKYLKEQYS